MKFHDDMITLRALEPEDIDVMTRWENDAELWIYGSTNAPFSREQIRGYISTYNADIFSAGQLRLMICLNHGEDSGKAVGAVDITDFDPVNRRAQLGVLVDREYQRRGVASRAMALVENYCFERLGMHQLWAVVPDDNLPSRALFDSRGFRVSGHLRSWIRVGRRFIDAYHYYKLLV